MKARFDLPPTKEMRAAAEKVIKEAEAQIAQQQRLAIVREMKISCIVLNTLFGFGADRIGKFIREMEKQSREMAERPEQWYYVDEYLREKLGVVYDAEDLEERELHSRMIHEEEGRKWRKY